MRLIDADALKEKLEQHLSIFPKFGTDKMKIRRDEIINCIADVVNAPTVREWIPVSERLPKETDRVLTYDSIGHIDFGQYDRGLWYWEAEACADYWLRNDGVLAWMPLPEPYREDGEA